MPYNYVKLTYKISQSGKLWRGVCVELGTSIQGKSRQDTLKKLREAVKCHLNTLQDVGEIERFFSENGIVLHTSETPTEEIEEVTIEVDQKVPVTC
jgi:predicted RNase H-like HicB family nuclease